MKAPLMALENFLACFSMSSLKLRSFWSKRSYFEPTKNATACLFSARALLYHCLTATREFFFVRSKTNSSTLASSQTSGKFFVLFLAPQVPQGKRNFHVF